MKGKKTMKKAFVYLTALLITLSTFFNLSPHVAFADSFSGTKAFFMVFFPFILFYNR